MNIFERAHDLLLGERHANYRKQKLVFLSAINKLAKNNNYEFRFIDKLGKWYNFKEIESTSFFSNSALFVYPYMHCEAIIVLSNYSTELFIGNFLREQGVKALGFDTDYFCKDLDYYCTGNGNTISSEEYIIKNILEITKKLKEAQKASFP